MGFRWGGVKVQEELQTGVFNGHECLEACSGEPHERNRVEDRGQVQRVGQINGMRLGDRKHGA